DSAWGVHLARLIAAASIAGVVRLAKGTGSLQYPVFAAGSVALLLMFPYSPSDRYLVPLLPLILAGLSTELLHMTRLATAAMRSNVFGNRVMAAALLCCIATVAFGSIVSAFRADFGYWPSGMEESRRSLRLRGEVYKWINSHLMPTSNLIAYDDPVLYLYT